MKPRVFIGSSTEQVEVANAIQQNLEHACEPTVWNQGTFQLTSNVLDDLLGELGKTDFGIFVFGPDDIAIIKGQHHQTTRDNVIFELGLFIGRLGKKRTFFVLPRGLGNGLRLPSDLLGVMPATYDANRSDLRAALGSPCTEMRRIIGRLGIRNECRLDILQSQKDVFTYVFNRLNPYSDISLTQDFLKNLPSGKPFLTIDDVLYPLDSLIHHYVPQFIEPWMRVYFAYKLKKAVRVKAERKSLLAYYRLGISFSKRDDKWCEGFPLGIPSNVNLVYSRQRVSKVRNAGRQIETRNTENQEVNDEGSVIGLPVLYSDDDGKNESIGVVGISSPNETEVAQPAYEALALELSILFSALFYAYGRYLQKSKKFEEVVAQLRNEIADHYDSKNPFRH